MARSCRAEWRRGEVTNTGSKGLLLHDGEGHAWLGDTLMPRAEGRAMGRRGGVAQGLEDVSTAGDETEHRREWRSGWGGRPT